MYYTQLKSLGNLVNAFNELNKAGDILAISEPTFKFLEETFKGLSETEILAKLATSGLSDELKKQIGDIAGVTISNEALSASQKGATASTGTLSTAFKGLGAKIKATTASMWAFLTTTPAGWATLAVTAIGSVVAGVYAYNKAIDKAVDNAKEKLSEVASEYDEVTSKIAENNEKIKELEVLRKSGNLSIVDSEDLDELKAQNEELRIRQQYLEMQKENANQDIVEASKKKYNRDYGRKNTTDSSIESYKEELRKPKSQGHASSYLTGEGGSQYQSSTPYAAGQQDALDEESDTLTALIAKYQYYEEEKAKAVQAGDGESIEKYNTKLEETAEKLIEDRTALQGFRDDLSLTGESSTELDDVTDKLKLIDDTLLSKGRKLVEFINAKSFSDQKAKLVELADTGKLTTESLSESFPELSAYLEENGLELQDLIGVLRDYKAELETVADSGSTLPLSISDTITQLDTQLRPALEALKKSYQDIFTEDGFTLENVDTSMLAGIKSQLESLGKELNVEIDYSSFEDFVSILNDTESTEYDVQKAFNELATTITNTALSGSEDFETLKAALEDFGIENSELVAFENLIGNTESLKKAGLDLATASEAQIIAFANEVVSAENVTQAIDMLTFAKLSADAANMDTSTEVANLKTLAENAGYTGDVIKYLTELEQIYQGISSGTIPSADIPRKLERAKELTALIQSSANNINYEPKFNGNPGKSSASKAGKEAADAYLEAFEKELKKLDDLKSRGKHNCPLLQ